MEIEQLLGEINRREDRIKELLNSNYTCRPRKNGRTQEIRWLEGEVYHLWEKVRLARALRETND